MTTKTTLDISGPVTLARENAGMSQADVAYASRSLPKEFWISQSKVARIERGDHVSAVDVLVLAYVFRMKPEDFSPEAKEAVNGLRLLLPRDHSNDSDTDPTDSGPNHGDVNELSSFVCTRSPHQLQLIAAA